MLSDTEAGKLRVKSSDDRWINAAVRRSDIIFVEAEEKRRKTENDGEETTPAAEATLTGGSSGAGNRHRRRRAHCPARFDQARRLHRQLHRLQERQWRREFDSSEDRSVLPMNLQMIPEPLTRTRLRSR